MIPPVEIEKWLEGGPWLFKEEPWWPKVGSSLERIPAFTVHCSRWYDAADRTHHELAHLICATNEQIYQDSWGIPDFALDKPLKWESALHEVKVIWVENVLIKHIQIDRWGRKREWSGDSCRPIAIAMNAYQFKRDEYEDFEAHAARRWALQHQLDSIAYLADIQACWVELQRKYSLVRSG